MRQALLPVLRDQLAVGVQRVGVAGQREGGDIGVEPVDDAARLLARSAMRLFDRDVLAGLGLPVLGEGGVELDVELARRVVRDVEQLDLGWACAGPRAAVSAMAEMAWNSQRRPALHGGLPSDQVALNAMIRGTPMNRNE